MSKGKKHTRNEPAKLTWVERIKVVVELALGNVLERQGWNDNERVKFERWLLEVDLSSWQPPALRNSQKQNNRNDRKSAKTI